MSLTLAHRGMESVTPWVNGNVGLGNRSLPTTPESVSEKLPLVYRSGELVITADARVDNRAELIRELELDNREASIGDSEIILAAYEKWGGLCTEKILGDFAFAIWDASRQRLFCARDHFGVRPFYYFLSDKLFVFASEIKALLALAEVPRRVNEVMVANFFAPTDNDHSNTCYSQIMRIPCAHSLAVQEEKIRVDNYWSLNPAHTLTMRSDEEYAEGFREIFIEAVRCRMRSEFPIGSTLSGGLDSSSITCVARKLMRENGNVPLRTFSAVFDRVKQCDEREYQNAVLEDGDVDPHFLRADEISPLTGIDQLLMHQDQLFPGGNQYIIWCISKMAQECGVRVMLEGYDGDTVVSHGAAYLYELARNKRWVALARELRGYTRNMTGQAWPAAMWSWMLRYSALAKVNRSKPVRLGQRALRAVRSPQAPSDSMSLRQAWTDLLSSKFISRTGIEQRRLAARRGAPRTEREDHHRKLTWSVSQDTFEMMNAIGSAFAIEFRFPFYDIRLAEYCLALPPEQKMHHGLTRMVLRRGMEGILPPKVQWRRDKSNLYDSFEQGLMNFEQARVEKLVKEDLPIIEDYVDADAVRNASLRYKAHKPAGSDIGSLWNVLMLARWLQVTGLRP
jgi:asparagine synthase (glutamine-hydrolysing)